MERRKLLCFLSAAMLASPLPSAAEQELKVLTGAGLAVPVRALAADFGRGAGMTVSVTTDTAGGVQRRMEAGGKFDLVIGTEAVIDTLAREKLVSPPHVRIARMVEGIAAKSGTPPPDLHDAAAVKRTLLAARSIAYVDPVSGAVSGAFLLGIAEKMGIADRVKVKAVLTQTGAAVSAAVASGKAELGVTLISEFLSSKEVTAWPLPAEIQMTTIYAAAVAAHPANPAAKALLAELGGAKGREVIEKSGLAPVR